jgi:hypothetical protein
MKKISINFRLLFIVLPLVFLLVNCSKGVQSQVITPSADSTIFIPKGDVTVACYYFPNWGPVLTSEWNTLKFATPKFPGHQQPKVPMWGYENENDPVVMAKKIDSAANNGINAFIFDWYYYDPATAETPGGKYLYNALEEGFLGASNNAKLKFAVMWCNHDVGTMKGAVSPKTFDEISDYVIEHYFKHPSYWKIDGCPYFSIYQFDTFLQTFNNDTTAAVAALQRFRSKVKAAGFPDLHLDGSLWGLRGANRDQMIKMLVINSLSSYVWIHHVVLPDFPTSDYVNAADKYFKYVENGGGYNGLETPANTIQAPYYLNVTMGWDSSPRSGAVTSSYWMAHQSPYPFGPVMVKNTPYQFKKYLAKAKSLTMLKPQNQRIIIINSWNEWGEGSYLEPDLVNGMKYLNAIKDVFIK